MKKILPYLLIGGIAYLYWKNYQNSNSMVPANPVKLTDENGNPLDPKRDPNFLVKPRLNGFPTIF